MWQKEVTKEFELPNWRLYHLPILSETAEEKERKSAFNGSIK